MGQGEPTAKHKLAASTRQPDLPDFTPFGQIASGSLLPEAGARTALDVSPGRGVTAPLRTWSWVASDLVHRLIYRARDPGAGGLRLHGWHHLPVPTAELAGGGFGHVQVSGDDRQTIALLCHELSYSPADPPGASKHRTDFVHLGHPQDGPEGSLGVRTPNKRNSCKGEQKN